jgi:hypothetical protein
MATTGGQVADKLWCTTQWSTNFDQNRSLPYDLFVHLLRAAFMGNQSTDKNYEGIPLDGQSRVASVSWHGNMCSDRWSGAFCGSWTSTASGSCFVSAACGCDVLTGHGHGPPYHLGRMQW